MICDPEEDYAKKLAEAVLRMKEVMLQVRICSSFETMKKLLEMGHIQVLLISEDFPLREREQVQAGKKIILTREHCTDLGDHEVELMKYQPADKLTAGIIKLCRDDIRSPPRTGRGREIILGIYSPIHRIGKTTLAVKLGRLLSQKENVLYINLETYAGIGGYFSEQEGQDLSHLLYYAKQDNGDISVRISAMVRQLGMLDYVPPMKVWTDLRDVTGKEWKAFLGRLAKQSTYRVIILDIGNSVGDLFTLLDSVDLLLIPTADDVYGRSKIVQYQQVLQVLGNQDLEAKAVYMDMLRPMRQIVKEALSEIEKWREKVARHAESRTAT